MYRFENPTCSNASKSRKHCFVRSPLHYNCTQLLLSSSLVNRQVSFRVYFKEDPCRQFFVYPVEWPRKPPRCLPVVLKQVNLLPSSQWGRDALLHAEWSQLQSHRRIKVLTRNVNIPTRVPARINPEIEMSTTSRIQLSSQHVSQSDLRAWNRPCSLTRTVSTSALYFEGLPYANSWPQKTPSACDCGPSVTKTSLLVSCANKTKKAICLLSIGAVFQKKKKRKKKQSLTFWLGTKVW